MAVFELSKPKDADGTFIRLSPKRNFYSEEYAEENMSLYLTDRPERDGNGDVHMRYRLHAKDAHSDEQAMRYIICCPKCGAELRQIGRCIDWNELGLYACPKCEMKK